MHFTPRVLCTGRDFRTKRTAPAGCCPSDPWPRLPGSIGRPPIRCARRTRLRRAPRSPLPDSRSEERTPAGCRVKFLHCPTPHSLKRASACEAMSSSSGVVSAMCCFFRSGTSMYCPADPAACERLSTMHARHIHAGEVGTEECRADRYYNRLFTVARPIAGAPDGHLYVQVALLKANGRRPS